MTVEFLGTAIRDLRTQAGLTQAELAARMGVTQSVVARWERNAVEPRLSSLGRLSDAVGTRVRLELEPAVGPDQWASVEANLRLSPAERSAKLVTGVRFVEAGRHAMRQAIGA